MDKVRRLVALLVIALCGASAFGWSSASSGIDVNGTSVSGKTLRSELSVIATSPTLQCYLVALNSVNFTPGAGGLSITAAGAASWTNLRIEGISIGQFARTTLKYHASPAELASATSSLEGELTQAAAAKQYHCPGTSAQALAVMTPEMRSIEIDAQAASLYLVGKLNSTIPLTTASMKKYFAAHQADYDTLCVSIALVNLSNVGAFAKAQAAGASVATLATTYSLDPSAAKGGAYSCYPPTSSSYASVRTDVVGTALNTFPTTPQYVSSNGTTYALFVAPTKRTPSTFAAAARVVLADLQNANASSANQVQQTILSRAAVAVDPAFGRWGLNTTGPSVFAPAIPAAKDVNAASVLASSNAASYK